MCHGHIPCHGVKPAPVRRDLCEVSVLDPGFRRDTFGPVLGPTFCCAGSALPPPAAALPIR
jgi:hypothetical protein